MVAGRLAGGTSRMFITAYKAVNYRVILSNLGRAHLVAILGEYSVFHALVRTLHSTNADLLTT